MKCKTFSDEIQAALPYVKKKRQLFSQHDDAAICSMLQVWNKSEVVCYLAGCNEIMPHLWKRLHFHVVFWVALPSGKRNTKASSLHYGSFGCSLSPCCKFEVNLREYAIWLVIMKYVLTEYLTASPSFEKYQSKQRFTLFDCCHAHDYFIAFSHRGMFRGVSWGSRNLGLQ